MAGQAAYLGAGSRLVQLGGITQGAWCVHHTGCMMCTRPLMECRSASPSASVAYPENLVRWIHGKISEKPSTNKLYKYNVRVPRVFRQYQIQFWNIHRKCRGLNWPRYVELHTDVTWHHAALQKLPQKYILNMLRVYCCWKPPSNKAGNQCNEWLVNDSPWKGCQGHMLKMYKIWFKSFHYKLGGLWLSS